MLLQSLYSALDASIVVVVVVVVVVAILVLHCMLTVTKTLFFQFSHTETELMKTLLTERMGNQPPRAPNTKISR